MTSSCAECGLDAEHLTIAQAADLIDALGPQYRKAFAAVGDDRARLRAKPEPDVWSSLEYVVHLRDAVRYHGALSNRALNEDRPEFGAPDPDAIARNESYNDANREEVLDSLEQQITRFAARARSLTENELDRVVIRAGNEITVRYMNRNVAHEGHHHLHDVRRLLA
jgi:DinB superfamily